MNLLSGVPSLTKSFSQKSSAGNTMPCQGHGIEFGRKGDDENDSDIEYTQEAGNMDYITENAECQMEIDDHHDHHRMAPVVSDISERYRNSLNGLARATSQTQSAPVSVSNGSPSSLLRLEVLIQPSPARSQSQMPRTIGPFSAPSPQTPAISHENSIDSNLGCRKTPAAPESVATTKVMSKSRGRPKGWKPGMSYASMRANSTPVSGEKPAIKHGANSTPRPKRRPPKSKSESIGDKTASKVPVKRGRPVKGPEPALRQRYLNSKPKFQTFGCEWIHKTESGKTVHCPAELQNMDTLRRHLRIVHGNKDPLTCCWGKCGQLEPSLRFKDMISFRRHVERTHLTNYVWHMGDGHQNKGILEVKQEMDSNKIPDYLYDENGVLLMPSYKEQQFEDTAGHLNRRRRLREIRRQANENAPDESEFNMQPMGNLGSSLLDVGNAS